MNNKNREIIKKAMIGAAVGTLVHISYKIGYSKSCRNTVANVIKAYENGCTLAVDFKDPITKIVTPVYMSIIK